MNEPSIGGTTPRRRQSRRRCLRSLASTASAFLAATAGCAASRKPTELLIATDLPGAVTSRLELSYKSAVPIAPRIVWLRPQPGFDLHSVASSAPGVQLVFSSTIRPLAALARTGRLERLGRPSDGPFWLSLPRPQVGWAIHPDVFEARALKLPESWSDVTDARLSQLIALGDPRTDPATLALLRQRLESKTSWPQAYADLVNAAALSLPIRRAGGSALAALAEGSAGLAPAVADDLPETAFQLDFHPEGPAPPAGFALMAGSTRPQDARGFLRFLLDTQRASEPEPSQPLENPLLPLLLGAALVDAQPELVHAKRVLDRSSRPGRLVRFLTEPPPWPPASITRLATGQEQSEGERLKDQLAAQIAPDLDTRFWLLESWNEPSAPLDGQTLDRLARSVDGKLAAEPRFRAWLKGEWTSWTRQRYRRVARQALAQQSALPQEAS